MSGKKKQELTPERKVILALLREIRQKDARARDLLRVHPAMAALSAKQRALVFYKLMCLVRLGAALDPMIYGELDKAKKLKPKLLDILRLGAFEILFEDIAPHAVISQMRLAAEAIAPQFKGLVHAVLTHIAEKYSDLLQTSKNTLLRYANGETIDKKELLAATMFAAALPKWLASAYIEELSPKELSDFVETAFSGSLQTYAVNTQLISTDELLDKLQAEAFSVRDYPDFPDTLLFQGVANLAEHDYIEKNILIPADLASIEVIDALHISAGKHILEIGQGRATKTLLMENYARSLGAPAKIVSLDVFESKTKLAEKRLSVAGYGSFTKSLCMDARTLSEKQNRDQIYRALHTLDSDATGFDLVFIDAPCTGTGTLSRHPEIAWSLSLPEKGLSEYTQQNLRFLMEAASFVPKGGKLAYATCSILHAENEDVVDAFLKTEIGQHFKRDAKDLHAHIKAADKHYVAQLVRIG